ncbi:hypothetical protein E4U35_008344 [Claviceps purpurea]|nr:hypothetical protein E4U28_004063 [Claviceps purpurea]KAG6159017.1 hypothetical protein E4U37_004640 [Claviceps purpurea]KAG6186318.1 hypothetical protein E4U36_000730 [Claviceps purpurea]KAG6208535.1 hypothetical protein E4U35_008344 [Claviceps purpurea]KAG6218429.1 hypothetical protein E4U50_001138 [Claviceps purpurea]
MSTSPSDRGDSDPAAPFLLQLFYRTGGFYRPDEFANRSLPPHISVYTWPDCTLNELAFELAASKVSALPYPAIGTRLAFQLVCPDLRSVSAISNAPPRYAVKDLGSIVIGQNSSGVAEPESTGTGGSTHDEPSPDSKKSLRDARFVVGDYVSCAILPPLDDGSVAPASIAQREFSSVGYRDARVNANTRGGGGGFQSRENEFAWPGVREGGRDSGRRGVAGGAMANVPIGEWRRGERLPNVPSRPRGGVGGSRGRW